MKKIYLLAVVALGMGFAATAQGFTDDMEEYSNGPLFTPRWSTWDATNTGDQQIIITQDQAFNGTKSGFIGNGQGPQDAILDFQGAAPAGSGVWSVDWQMYIPSGSAAYFNVQGSTDPSANDQQQFLSGNIAFNDDGSGSDDNAMGGSDFTFPFDQWFKVSVICDTTAETYILDVNGSAGAASPYGNASDGFAGIDFFANETNNAYYVDQVRFSDGLLDADDFTADVFSVFPNPVVNELTISSAASVDNVTVYDVLGKVVLTANPNTISPAIDMSNLSSGAYLVKVTIGNASKTVKVLK